MGVSNSKFALLCGATAVFMSARASAQDAASPPPTNSATPAVATGNSNHSTPASTELAQAAPSDTGPAIIVTATRRAENLQNVPGQVTAVTSSDIRRLNLHTLDDFSSRVPGLTTVPAGATSQIIIRGVTTGFQLSGSVGLYLDDIPIGASTSFGLGATSFNVNVFDLDRLEVLNGPQGTLFGANSLGGTVRYITAAPDPHHFGGELDAEGSFTDHGGFNDSLRGMVNAPLPGGAGAIRFDAANEYTSGYMDDPVYHRSNQGGFHTYLYRGSILLTPTEDFDIRLTGFSQRVAAVGVTTEFQDPVTHQPVLGAYKQAYPVPQNKDVLFDVASAEANWNLHWAKLTAVVGAQFGRGRYEDDFSLTYDPLFKPFGAGADPFRLFVDTDTKKFTQEVRLASGEQSDFLQWIVGVYHDYEETTEVTNLYDDAHPGGTLFGMPIFLARLPSNYAEIAAYGDATINFTHRLSLTAGVRYSHQKQNYDVTDSGLLLGSATPVTRPAVQSTQNVTTYLINPKYRITDNTMLYARIASGFRPGGPQLIVLPGGSSTFKPDTLWNYEVGEKSTFFNNRLTLNADAYDIEWSNIQLVVNVQGINQLVNAANARVQGLEGAFSYMFAPNFTLGGSATYSDARLTTPAPVVGVSTSGARLPLSPRFTFALQAGYNFNIAPDYTGALTLTDRYVGERNAGFGTIPSPNYREPGFNTVDLNLALFVPHGLELDLFAHNLTNVRGVEGASPGALEYNPTSPVPLLLSQPRTIGATLRARFH